MCSWVGAAVDNPTFIQGTICVTSSACIWGGGGGGGGKGYRSIDCGRLLVWNYNSLFPPPFRKALKQKMEVAFLKEVAILLKMWTLFHLPIRLQLEWYACLE